MSALADAKEFVKSIIAKRQITEYLAQSTTPRLNVGCGINVIPGWLNVDQITGPPGVVFLKGDDHWQIPDNSFDAVLCEHMIEHVPKAVGRSILSESFRILKPGGVFRAVTPDIEFLACLLSENSSDITLYMDSMKAFLGVAEMTRVDAVNAAFRNYGHSYLYSPEELKAELLNAGFEQITAGRGGVPRNPVFIGAEGHSKVIGAHVNAIEAFSLEAVKPG